MSFFRRRMNMLSKTPMSTLRTTGRKGLRVALTSALAAILSLTLAFMLVACGTTTQPPADAGNTPAPDAPSNVVEPQGTIRLATTTSTKDSGLLDAILPEFTATTGWEVEVISVGSGEAMAMGEAGEADVLLVHSPAAEKAFLEGGNADASGRLDVMYNDYVIVGPAQQSSLDWSTVSNDALAAFALLAASGTVGEASFISRGDESGTHKKELSIWEKAQISPEGDWYIIAGDGMGAVITMADEKQAYTLADRATWLNVGSNTGLAICVEKDPSGILNNQYGVICVNPEKNEQINHEGAVSCQQWITSPETQALIGAFGVEDYGQQLFTPNAQ
jgi:tungstate transport system substrate-binding protein